MDDKQETSTTSVVKYAIDTNVGETQMTICKAKFQWIIHDYSVYSQHHQHTALLLNSPIFPSKENDGNKWSLTLTPNGVVADRNVVLLYLSPVSDKLNKIHSIKIKYHIPAKEPEKSYTKDYVTKFPYDKGAEWKELINRNDLFDKANGFLPDDKLTIVCEITAFGAPFNIITLELQIPKCEMREKMGYLFDSGDFSDVTLVASKQEILAHKAILAAASTVFSAMFKNEMMENQKNRVEIEDVEAEVIKEMLRFVYTGKTAKLDEMAFDLLAVAEKYNLRVLKANCEAAMCRNTSIENSADILVHADLHTAHNCKKKTMNFISAHYGEVKETESYKTVVQSHPSLVIELLTHSVMEMKVDK